MAMARRKQQRRHAIDVAMMQGIDSKRFDFESFISTGSSQDTSEPQCPLPPAVLYEMERMRRNGLKYVAPKDQLKWDSDRARDN